MYASILCEILVNTNQLIETHAGDRCEFPISVKHTSCASKNIQDIHTHHVKDHVGMLCPNRGKHGVFCGF